MKKYNLNAMVTVSAYTTIEADSLEEAIRKADSRAVVFGGEDSDADENESWTINEADGVARKIKEA